MSSASEEQENHWPGYVDALTTMTMMLIFVMMILSVAMFSMSESVSRSMVEKIAAAAGISITSDTMTTEEIVQQVTDRLGEKKPGAAPPAADALPGEEKRISSTLAAPPQRPDAPVRVENAPAMLTLAFASRATALDAGAHREMVTFVEASGHLTSEKRFEIRAYASAQAGGISDSRRVAYYRAMTLRAQLIGLGVVPQRIKMQVDDRPSTEDAALVQIFIR
jgi:hypothetical protein